MASPELVSVGAFGFGVSILVFALMGTFLQGVRPLFKRGRLELPVLLVGATTFLWLLLEYLMMAFLRGSFHFTTAVWSKMITDTMLAMLASPLIFLLLYSLAGLSRYEIKYDGLRYSFDGR
jgi:cell shape-determining protein MreD